MVKIAILGASPNKGKYSNKCLRAYLSKGFEVIPINPHYEEIEGLKTVPLSDVDAEILSVYINPGKFKDLISAIPDSIKIIYLNPGAENINDERLDKFKVKKVCSIRALGLNPGNF